MPAAATRVASLSELVPGVTAEFFARLAGKEQRVTREGHPFFRVTFQDATGHVAAMLWHDSPFFPECESSWKKGDAFRVRGRFSESRYGPQIELLAVRPALPADAEEGFDPDRLFQSARVDPAEMFDALLGLAQEQIADAALRRLVLDLHAAHRDDLLRWPAASQKHHAFPGGYLEHVLSVTRIGVYLANKYQRDYPSLDLSKDLVVAGAMLHDIGKLIELRVSPEGGEYTPAGRLIGHMLLGRDIVRDFAATIPELDHEMLMRLEHIVIAHQGRPEWGSPTPPSTPEALLVHYADEIDAKLDILAAALAAPHQANEPFTTRDNPLRRLFYRGMPSNSHHPSRPDDQRS